MIERFRQWYGMKQRGEKRVAPYPQTGRVFVSKIEGTKARLGPVKIGSKATVTMTARVIRADGTIEDLT